MQKRCTIFFEGEWKSANIYNYCVIMVENADEDIQVPFYLTDAHEMNWVTEFLDGPFFARTTRPKGCLVSLKSANRNVRGERVGRFRVDFHHWQPRHERSAFQFYTRSHSELNSDPPQFKEWHDSVYSDQRDYADCTQRAMIQTYAVIIATTPNTIRYSMAYYSVGSSAVFSRRVLASADTDAPTDRKCSRRRRQARAL